MKLQFRLCQTLNCTRRNIHVGLLGPPEIRKTNTNQPKQDPFMSLMVTKFNKTVASSTPVMGLTENESGTYLSSGNPCLDFFFHVVPDTPARNLTERLSTAWDHNPLTTLKLVCNLRGVRGTGKSDKEGFYTAALWLHGLHPKTLACNVPSFAGFGYFKDLPEIIFRLLGGSKVEKIQRTRERKSRWKKCKGRKGNKKQEMTRESRITIATVKNKLVKERACAIREEKRINMAKKVIERYYSDPDFRFLHEQVSDYFAECLKNDMKLYESGKNRRKISFAAKWCPSINSSFDRSTLICESIARKVFPKDMYEEYQGIEDAHYAYRVRDRLRKEVLVPLRKALELPEVYMSANKWDSLPYNRVTSVAMTLYEDKFLKHDVERFNKYLEDVKVGKVRIAAGALLPHEIFRSLDNDDSGGGQVAELQWKRMVDDLIKVGKLRNCMAICDVSGSMQGIPMEVSVALGILVSELSEEPWKGRLITFSENPQLQIVEGYDLRSKQAFVWDMNWGMNTDFQKVFDVILEVAVDGNLKPEQMIKRLFVFSDMEFDAASANPWETDYQVIVKKYTEKGYGSVVPQIVFWNLRYSESTPVVGTQNGVALVSGFSKNLLKLFLDNEGEINPEQVMEAAISGKLYQKLVVLD